MLAEKAALLSDREALIEQFLRGTKWQEAQRVKLPSDASFRSYERLVLGDESFMLMNAPPPKEDVRPFVQVTALLQRQELRAPRIFAEDAAAGLLILEDFGVDSYSNTLKVNAENEFLFYREALEVLAALHQAREAATRDWQQSIAPYDEEVLLREVALFSDWFLPQAVGAEKAQQVKAEFMSLWQELLAKGLHQQNILVLRDYHVDNLMRTQGATPTQRVGLLDYQDALLGDAAYDVVSLIEDARRDLQPENVQPLIADYLEMTDENAADFMPRYALLGAQRNMKIVGIFCRLCLRDGKVHYLDYLPRVWRHLQQDLSHPMLGDLGRWVKINVPAEFQGAFVANKTIGALE